LNHWTAFKELTLIKLLDVQATKPHQLKLSFSDHTYGIIDGARYLSTRQGPLLEALRGPTYFARCFVGADARCWPNGLELPAARLYELSAVSEMAE
jgi:hypothetical protein